MKVEVVTGTCQAQPGLNFPQLSPEPEPRCIAWIRGQKQDRRPLGRRVTVELVAVEPDGDLVESQIAPADGTLKKTGKWKLSDTGKLYFYRDDPSKPAKVLEIESATKDKLVVKR